MPTINISFDSKTAELESVEVNGVTFHKDIFTGHEFDELDISKYDKDFDELTLAVYKVHSRLIEAKRLLRRHKVLLNTGHYGMFDVVARQFESEIDNFLEGEKK